MHDLEAKISHEVYIAVAVERLWSVLTTSQGWDGWWTRGTTIDPRQGGFLHFRWSNFGIGMYSMEDRAEIIELDEMSRLSFIWHPGEFETKVEFKLDAWGEGVRLSVLESGFPNCAEGWKCALLNGCGWGEALTLLKFYLEKSVVYEIVPNPDKSSG